MLVGGIACRYERPAGGAGATRLYIMSLGVLAPYRGRGVGQRLLVRALAEALREGSAADVYLHVQARPARRKDARAAFINAQTPRSRRARRAQINNEDAIAFYKKFGFEARGAAGDAAARGPPPRADRRLEGLRAAAKAARD